jgi:hypothetical protein
MPRSGSFVKLLKAMGWGYEPLGCWLLMINDALCLLAVEK